MDDDLRARLLAVGVDPDDRFEPAAAWKALRDRYGATITLVERYAIEAHLRGVESDELPEMVRKGLSHEVLAVQFPGIEMIGESGGDPVEVVPYDRSWPGRFSAWHSRLAEALGSSATAIHHIGSTSVPGLVAKPVIDIQIGVTDLEDEYTYLPAIESVGVSLRSRDSRHRYFRPERGRPRVVQIHVSEAGGQWAIDHVLFRDYLRAHPESRDEYAALKTGLAEQYQDDRLAYTDAKAGFILETLTVARQWAADTGWSIPPN